MLIPRLRHLWHVRTMPRAAMIIAALGIVTGLAFLPGTLGTVHSQATGPAVPIVGNPPDLPTTTTVETVTVNAATGAVTLPNVPSGVDTQVQVGTAGGNVAAHVDVPPDQPPVAITLQGNATSVSYSATGAPGGTFYLQIGNEQWRLVTIPADCATASQGYCSVSGTIPSQ